MKGSFQRLQQFGRVKRKRERFLLKSHNTKVVRPAITQGGWSHITQHHVNGHMNMIQNLRLHLLRANIAFNKHHPLPLDRFNKRQTHNDHRP
ncbi:hypothetical protein FGO68_gene6851 [Halteria grandinella]|uniref:Uncharacterized protein n=1 Tax=Halteria grandinella TaxID=5974 RepID=A0A8J8SUZ9_HALGN|nr:hypothetical protein FGO68_gene6851 [Halteria grandinella]